MRTKLLLCIVSLGIMPASPLMASSERGDFWDPQVRHIESEDRVEALQRQISADAEVIRASVVEIKKLLAQQTAAQPQPDQTNKLKVLEEQVRLMAEENQALRQWVGCFITVRKEKEKERQSLGGFPSDAILSMLVSDAPAMLKIADLQVNALTKMAAELGFQLPKDETPQLVDLLEDRARNPNYEAYRARHDEQQRKQAESFSSMYNPAPQSAPGLSAKSVPGVRNTRK